MYWTLSDGQSVDLTSSTHSRSFCRRSRLDTTRRPSHAATKTDAKLISGRKRTPLRCSLSDDVPSSEVHQSSFLHEMIKFGKEAPTMKDIDSFYNEVPSEVRGAMTHCIERLLGSLCPQIFDVRYTSITRHFETMILSVVITGYMLKNAEVRMNLDKSLADATEDPVEAPDEVVTLDAGQRASLESSTKNYIAFLEKKVKVLEKKANKSDIDSAKQNSIIQFIMELDADRIEDLIKYISGEVLESMHICAKEFIDEGKDENNETVCTMNHREMVRLIEWLMCFGYHLRLKEIRHEMESAFQIDTTSSLLE